MSNEPQVATQKAELTEHSIRVLLVDDQAMIGEAVRRMLASDAEIEFHYCGDPTKAVPLAAELQPTVILQDLVMPEVDGMTLVKFYRANPATKDTPLIVLSTKEEAKTKAEAFSLGANDYLVKLPDPLELIARIRYHSRGYINLLQRNEAFERLNATNEQLASEINQAAKYVFSLLPPPLEGEVTSEWKFIPSTELGGDSFGYHWLDDDHLAMYLLDVCGHGVGAALLSVSAINTLRGKTLPGCDFLVPSQVLCGMNEAYRMEDHDDMYFTIWYGVYNKHTREITYSGGGHPPGLLLSGDSEAAATPTQLESQGPMPGAMGEFPYGEEKIKVGPFGRLYLYSDGVYEIQMDGDGDMWPFDDFVDFMAKPKASGESAIDRIYEHIKVMGKREILEDDFSMVEFNFA